MVYKMFEILEKKIIQINVGIKLHVLDHEIHTFFETHHIQIREYCG